MTNIVGDLTIRLYDRLRAKTPIDTGNMLAHIKKEGDYGSKMQISISAPMNTRGGLTSKRTKSVVRNVNSNYDYARDVNYSRKSPHRFWVEAQIKQAVSITMSNVKYGLY